MINRKSANRVISAFTFTVFAAQGYAAEHELRFTHMFPESHFAWAHAGEQLTQKVSAATDGSVGFQTFPSGQLGKDFVGLMDSGLADISILIAAYAPDKLPLTSVAELPQSGATSCSETEKLWSIIQPGGALYEAEYEPKGLHPLFVAVLPPYKFITTSKPVHALEDVQGLKIRASGAAMQTAVRSLGAVAVQMTATEINDSLRRGTVDGAIWPYHSAPPYGLEPLLKYGIEGPTLGATAIVYAMTQDAWTQLSESEQAAFKAASREIQPEFCGWLDGEEDRVRQNMIDEHGYKPKVLSEEETSQWQAKLDPVADEWVKRMESQGKPGSAMLKAYQDAGQ